MNEHITTGKIGENSTCHFLIKNGYHIFDRNYRMPWGEIDIIARDPDTTLVFVEVKTMQAGGSLKPEDNLTRAKLQKLRRTCEKFVATHQDLVREDRGWRIDLVALTMSNKDCLINHYENI
jgi:putative endonuclease